MIIIHNVQFPSFLPCFAKDCPVAAEHDKYFFCRRRFNLRLRDIHQLARKNCQERHLVWWYFLLLNWLKKFAKTMMMKSIGQGFALWMHCSCFLHKYCTCCDIVDSRWIRDCFTAFATMTAIFAANGSATYVTLVWMLDMIWFWKTAGLCNLGQVDSVEKILQRWRTCTSSTGMHTTAPCLCYFWFNPIEVIFLGNGYWCCLAL